MAELAALAERSDSADLIGELVLPSDSPDAWAVVQETLCGPMECPADLDTMLTKFSETDPEPKVCSFFSDFDPTTSAAFDLAAFMQTGAPLMLEVALQMPELFPSGTTVPIFKMRSSWPGEAGSLGKQSYALTRRQCACLLAHSFFGSLKRPPDVEPNDFRFTVRDLFVGTAVSPNSAVTFLNYFGSLARHGIPEGPDDIVTFERLGFKKGPLPWQWEGNEKPLCKVEIVDGNIDDCAADVHAEFANAFVGGGVMTGDAAMEETLFLVKPELMVAMALQNRMVDEEAVCVSGAQKYSSTSGFGQSFEFAGEYDRSRRPDPPPRVAAIDAVRGGGPAMTERALLRDMNKARAAFEGAVELATGHWGCGAYGNHNDLMFIKQWLAASEAGVRKMYYHDFNRNQSHHIFPLIRKLGHLTVGELWAFLLELSRPLVPCNMKDFSVRVADISTGKLKPGGSGETRGLRRHSNPGAAAGAAETLPLALEETKGKSGTADPAHSSEADGDAGAAQRQQEEESEPEEPAVVFSLAELVAGCPDGVDPMMKEGSLSNADFAAAFGMSRCEFSKLPAWRQGAAKKKVGVF
mmetsp:Transcript_87813/g.250026  ORF Transcript_87813/g.250026 Transcript_87813/m.250026 type:complete len:580 (-) Transcript_87813:5092-6831(-)|eukprot:CAMPEP_0119500300 /NCGR_PEP_ID=MMETSP1344-20130328/22478_1 /TAXON_ID=236787 /ORGANISM="Florenciella parvula, Strain CCMP2471" /LENGTH=579 /DNA_ID=CAMNT_0007536371 /DNA_START=58 /DNA_END=1797 /DNA_ORIENTATION=-